MRRLLALGWKFRWLALILLVGGIALGWVQRGPILTRYYLARLARCADGDEDAWIARLTSLDNAAVPSLLDALAGADAHLAPRIERCLATLMQAWGPTDPRTS